MTAQTHDTRADADRLRAAGLPESFCPMPWVHAYADPRGDIRPCCWYDGQLPGNPNLAQMNGMDDVMRCQGMAETRAAFLSGETPDACMLCRKREEYGQYSKRMKGMDSVSDDELRSFAAGDADGGIESYVLRHFDFRFDNTCNFRCRTCSPTNSSRIEAEERSAGNPSSIGGFDRGKWNDEFQGRVAQARSVYFAGGEPLIMDSTYTTLQRLLDEGNSGAVISTSTNLSQLSNGGRRILDLWRGFSDVMVNISLDHHGDRAEYVRDGTSWHGIVENYRLLRSSCPHVRVQIDCVVSVLNVLDLTEIVDVFGVTFPGTHVNFIPIMGKIHFHPSNLPHDAKLVARERISGWCERNQHDRATISALRWVHGDMEPAARSDSPAKFMAYMSRLDSLRGESFGDRLPELAGFYHGCIAR